MDSVASQLNNVSAFLSQQRPIHLVAATALTTTSLLAAWVVMDYNAWREFGTGGTPPTWAGYWRMTKIRFNRLLASDDLRDPSPLDASAGPRYLPADFDQKRRVGPRPRIMARTMPQRQVPYKKSDFDDGVEARVQSMCATLALKYEKLVYLAPAKTEGGAADGIYSREELETLNPAVKHPKNKILAGEVGHAHPADGSLHVWLSEGDARRVVEGGWGERFPLAFVDKGWVMVYAPKTMTEADVVEEILKSGIGWVCGQKVE
ncbi:uncharacterized protein HMPREF1541_08765 [Cyphellophora europaea CBS 101466]|uniref:Luciferase domain-containing protein n=1 Tax=Cyphellophora europaea (strain CBS 101466) TaxID=1220924 RepID=W2RJ24_CYPE1|nr:uncharacterized protein HMPREF1541_08765 [Cyphellophora europaea CBS 101466]ETN36487.1 hypothetical protein HMPREF1541_08765 [Cyphellophora europaea CBS 101466]